MTRSTIIGGVFAVTAILLTIGFGLRAGERSAAAFATLPAVTGPPAGAQAGFLYGRVTTTEGEVYEGRLRFGGDEEALWGNYFNGFKKENPWLAHVPRESLPRKRVSWTVFDVELAVGPRTGVGRPFMARFGDITRLEARGRDLWVTLKSGTVVHLDRYAADDFADGVRVWDANGGLVELGERQIRAIDFLPAPRAGAKLQPLYGTVHTRHGDFTGLVQWDREASLANDQLHGRGVEGDVVLTFDAIRSIARRSGEGALVTLRDGREVVLSATRLRGGGNRGMYVDDPRYGRVLISWDAFERLDLGAGGSVPAYDGFEAGAPLTGTVVTRAGQHLTGRLVYDLDESETTETLDAPARGVDFTIPFSLIASIQPRPSGDAADARVALRSGEELHLERAGDLAAANAGMLVFTVPGSDPHFVPWGDVERIELDAAD